MTDTKWTASLAYKMYKPGTLRVWVYGKEIFRNAEVPSFTEKDGLLTVTIKESDG